MILCCWYLTSIGQDTTLLNFSLPSINGDTITFPSGGNKKFLLVVTASLDSNASQLLELKKLQQQYSGNVVLVLVPTNDFNSEPGTNEMIQSVFQSMSFSAKVSMKASIIGSNPNPLFNWLKVQIPLVGGTGQPVVPFVKYLFNTSGILERVFSSSTRPMNTTITSAISN